MKLSWKNGVSVEYKDSHIIIDPQNNHVHSKNAFITHAHMDHSHAFRFNNLLKYSSEQTMKLVSIHDLPVEGWQPLAAKNKIHIDDIEVVPHNSGHVLGSHEFEVVTPDGNVLFTGDFNTAYSKTMKPAEPISCDILVVESTFGSPNFKFPPEEQIAKEMIDWAESILAGGRIPVFQTDPLGNAQEIIRIFNEAPDISVMTHWKVSKISEVYKFYGHNLEFIDEKSEEATEIISSRNFVLITPKNFSLPNNFKFAPALVSGWALWTRVKSFPLSDHADFPRLMKFVEDCNPKIVLTCHSGRFDEVLSKQIEKKLKIRSYPIDLIPTTLPSK